MNKLDLEKFVNDGLSSYDISKKLNKSQTSIMYWMNKFGLKSKFKKATVYDKIDWKTCQLLYDTGLSMKEMRKFGYSLNALNWAIKNGNFISRKPGDSLKLTHASGKVDYSVYRTDEFRKKISPNGGYKENSGRCKHISFSKKDGTIVKLQGTWEERLANFFEENEIPWIKNRVGYKYIFDSKDRLYFPDFLLPTYNIYVEVKGNETEKDREKWRQFPFKLLIIKKNEIKNLKSWWESNSFIDHHD